MNECATTAELLRVKRQFLPIRPVLAGAKVHWKIEGAKG